MKQKVLLFAGLVVAQLAIANCVALGISLHELYGSIVTYVDTSRELKKAKKELKKKNKEAKQAA